MSGKLTGQELRDLKSARQAAYRANKRLIARAVRMVDAQQKVVNVRAKYGPSMRPAPVVIKQIKSD